MNNSIYFRRRSRFCVPTPAKGDQVSVAHVATMLKNIEALGYTFSESLFKACQQLTLEQLTEFYAQIVPILKQARGGHRAHKPMYPNFPQQVMEMSEGELYMNAILHYLTDGQLLPETEKKERFPLLDNFKLTVIELGREEEFMSLFGQIAGSNASLSEQDKEDLEWYVRHFKNSVGNLLPTTVPQKENIAFIAGLLMKYTDNAAEFIGKFCRTATDILRLAVAMSNGDVSLAKASQFRNFTRTERSTLLSLVNNLKNPIEDMLRYKSRWVRLAEKLHPGDYKKLYPQAAEALATLKQKGISTFNGRVETAISAKDIGAAVMALYQRPGEFARRLDHLLRLAQNSSEVDAIVNTFTMSAANVSTPVLLQVRQHFIDRADDSQKLRVAFPKGNLAKAYAIESELPSLEASVCKAIIAACEKKLLARFKELPSLGNVYLDENLQNYLIPFSQRSASKAMRTIVRGSKLPLPENCKVVRFFIWWKNGIERTDIDLSATLLDENFSHKDTVSYYNLKGYGGCHSGDIVDAPKGASEFIDIDLNKALEMGVRYIVMTLHSFTQQPYCDLPECFAGWMSREKAGSGEIYDPRTVQDRVDITADTRQAIPLIIDALERRVIWCDMSLKSSPNWGYRAGTYGINVGGNNVANNLKGIALTLRSMVEMSKPNVYDLLALHAKARGKLVDDPSKAETVFSVENETPFQLETLASAYMQ